MYILKLQYMITYLFIGFSGSAAQRGLWSLRITRFLDHTKWRATVSRTPLDEWSARRRDLYLTIHTQQTNIHTPGGIRTHDRSRRAALDLRLRPRGLWDRHSYNLQYLKYKTTVQCVAEYKIFYNNNST
jgi:hypothetical protein